MDVEAAEFGGFGAEFPRDRNREIFRWYQGKESCYQGNARCASEQAGTAPERWFTKAVGIQEVSQPAEKQTLIPTPNKTPVLTFGTAALGQSYGVSNPVAPLSAEAAQALLDRCWERGIANIDTAAAYGDAEQRIGSWIKETGNRPVVFSKAPPLSSFADEEVGSVVRKFIDQSLARLKCTTLDGYLLHRAEDWRRQPVRRALLDAKDKGIVKATGLSGYEPNAFLELMTLDPVDVIQMPISLFDRAAEESGLLKAAGDKNVYVMARSIYLQGLLFMEPRRLPAHLSEAAPVLTALNQLAAETNLDLATIALHAALKSEGVGTAVLGFYDTSQADAAVNAWTRKVDPEVIAEARRIAGKLPPEITDPRQWPAR